MENPPVTAPEGPFFLSVRGKLASLTLIWPIIQQIFQRNKGFAVILLQHGHESFSTYELKKQENCKPHRFGDKSAGFMKADAWNVLAA